METLLTVATGWMVGVFMIARQMWPDSALYDEPLTAAYRIGIALLAALLLLGHTANKRARQAREQMQEEVDRITAERDAAIATSVQSFKMGHAVGEYAGYNQAQRRLANRLAG